MKLPYYLSITRSIQTNFKARQGSGLRMVVKNLGRNLMAVDQFLITNLFLDVWIFKKFDF